MSAHAATQHVPHGKPRHPWLPSMSERPRIHLDTGMHSAKSWSEAWTTGRENDRGCAIAAMYEDHRLLADSLLGASAATEARPRGARTSQHS